VGQVKPAFWADTHMLPLTSTSETPQIPVPTWQVGGCVMDSKWGVTGRVETKGNWEPSGCCQMGHRGPAAPIF
jgi:hypothetical protein